MTTPNTASAGSTAGSAATGTTVSPEIVARLAAVAPSYQSSIKTGVDTTDDELSAWAKAEGITDRFTRDATQDGVLFMDSAAFAYIHNQTPENTAFAVDPLIDAIARQSMDIFNGDYVASNDDEGEKMKASEAAAFQQPTSDAPAAEGDSQKSTSASTTEGATGSTAGATADNGASNGAFAGVAGSTTANAHGNRILEIIADVKKDASIAEHWAVAELESIGHALAHLL